MLKKLISIGLVVMVVLSLMMIGVANVSAATIIQQGSCGDNVTYTLDSNGVLIISGSGSMENYTYTSSVPWHNNIENIKSVIIEDGVTSIGDSVFIYCRFLESVAIPDSVTYIGHSAFNGCESLTSIDIPDFVTTISSCVFERCTSLTSITIPEGVTEIGNDAFCCCESLTSVTIPDSVTYIDSSTFFGCISLTSITIPEGVTEIGNEAFRECSSLTSIIIPDSVTSISELAFEDCTSLTSVTIPNSVDYIGDWAFSGCSSLTSITFPDSVTTIDTCAFYGCGSLTSITIPDSVTSFGYAAIGYYLDEDTDEDMPTTTHINVYTSNSIAIDYLLNNYFHHSVLGDYYVNYDESTIIPVANNEITVSGNDGQSIVTLDYDTANLKVTVPTVLPVNVDSNNNVTVADNAQISNLSNGSVDVTNAEIQTDEWSVVGFDTDFTKVPVDTKQYGFKLNGDDVSDGVNTSVFNTINGNDHIGLSYDANVAIQSQPVTNEDIGRIVFTVAWHK